MRVYKKKPGHGKQEAGTSTLESFFEWALELCRNDQTDRVMVETPDFRVTWDAPKKSQRAALERKRRKPVKG